MVLAANFCPISCDFGFLSRKISTFTKVSSRFHCFLPVVSRCQVQTLGFCSYLVWFFVSVFLLCWVYPTPFIDEVVVSPVCIFGASVERHKFTPRCNEFDWFMCLCADSALFDLL